MKVEPVWAEEREGSITDLAHWKPVDGSMTEISLPDRLAGRRAGALGAHAGGRSTSATRPGQASSRYLKGIAQKKIIGGQGRARRQGLRPAAWRRPAARQAHHRAGGGRPTTAPS